MTLVGRMPLAEEPLLIPPTEKSDPLLWEKVVVTACSPDCKCVVTVTATLDARLRSIHVHKCKRDHDAVMAELDAAAQARALDLVGGRAIK